jgi:hypothetical protein
MLESNSSFDSGHDDYNLALENTPSTFRVSFEYRSSTSPVCHKCLPAYIARRDQTPTKTQKRPSSAVLHVLLQRLE